MRSERRTSRKDVKRTSTRTSLDPSTPTSSRSTNSRNIPIQPKIQPVILVQKVPKYFLGKLEDGQHRIVVEQQGTVPLSVTDADLRDQLNANAAAETVQAASDVFQQGAASVTYVPTDGLSPGTTEFVGAGVEAVHLAAEETDHQNISAMDVYPLGHHIGAANTYVYATEYAPPYYQYQPLNSPGQQTYIIQQQSSPGSVDEDANAQLGHTTRASPATIQWLVNNYEPADGTSLPRCTLYEHYQRHCRENNLDQVNPASFGKLIRSVFHGLRTRRLGTRGNSKYHYYGIRIKPDSPLNNGMSSSISLNDDYSRQSFSHQISHVNTRSGSSRRSAMSNGGANSGRTSATIIVDSGVQHPQSNNSSAYRTPSPVYVSNGHSENTSAFQPCPNQSSNSSINGENSSEVDRELLGDGLVPDIAPPNLNELQHYLIPLGLNISHALKFFDSYSATCVEVLECVKQLQFDAVEECWATFWQPENEQEDMDEEDSSRTEKSKGLSQSQLFSMCTIPTMFNYMQTMDYSFYQVIAEVLIPDVLQPNMSSTLTTQIRNFAKSLECQMKKAMQGAPDYIQKKKLRTVRQLAQLLRRYTSLNHLATAARGVLQKPDQIQQMYQDFNRVDISNIQDQAGWICDCDPIFVSNLYSAFCENLRKFTTLEQWADWLEAVVDQVLAKYHSEPYAVTCDIAKNFLKNWSFYSSMVIRDITLRSALSFGSFHLIRLLFDEYLLYIVEAKLAKQSNKPIIAVMMMEKSDELVAQQGVDAVLASAVADNRIPGIENGIVTLAEGGSDDSTIYMEEEAIHFVTVSASTDQLPE